MMVVGTAVGSATGSAASRPLGGLGSGAGGGGGGPSERIDNGGFDTADGWDTADGAWVIALGVATNSTPLQFIERPLSAPLAGGEDFVFSFDASNPVVTQVLLYNSVTEAAQSIYMQQPSEGTNGSTGTVSGEFDTFRMRAAEDPGMVVDNISFVA